jgi:hypothetical protein
VIERLPIGRAEGSQSRDQDHIYRLILRDQVGGTERNGDLRKSAAFKPKKNLRMNQLENKADEIAGTIAQWL